ncbi:unnamed protein product [Schistocephalus solidus]|uniref:Uncharacterized protein n=1 Tax=Schistocephalus solidus TaxID=70667 RepID=A0A183SV62_SCHSO|nr:unnamed protein product [Schistocephalus solidus]
MEERSDKAGHETFYLYDWINAAYLRIFLLFLDAYLIVSRFYGACQNFYVLWLGKRRRILSQPSHHQTQRVVCNSELNAGRKCYTPQIYKREHQDEMLLGGEQDRPNRRSLGDQASFFRSTENNTLSDATSRFENSKYFNDGEIFCDVSIEKPATASEKMTTTEFLTFSQRRGLPACCCCLDFHYLLILTGIFFVFLGLALSFSAERSVTNSWILKRSALLSRLRAMDDYRKLTRNTVDYVQLAYLNTRRLRLERMNTEKQLQRLKRLQSRLNFEKDFQARQHLQEICSIVGSEEHATQRVHTVQESSLCRSLKQMRSSSYQVAPLGVLSTMETEQLKLPICAFLPINSAVESVVGHPGRLRPRQPPAPSPISGLLDSVLTPGLGRGGGESAVAAAQCYYHLKLIHAQVPAPPGVEHTVDLIEIDGRTVVTLITTCPPTPRKIETFLASHNRNIFHRSTSRTIWLPEPDRTSDPVRPPRAQRPQVGRKRKPKISKSHEKQSTESRV